MTMAMSVAAAPAALSASRGLAVKMMLIGCPGRNPIDGDKWPDDEVTFPQSLIPGFGFGARGGFYYRGSLLATHMESAGKRKNRR